MYKEKTNTTTKSAIKIENIGTGGWLLLEKIDDTSEDTSIDYKTIGRQNGTIQFTTTLYQIESVG